MFTKSSLTLSMLSCCPRCEAIAPQPAPPASCDLNNLYPEVSAVPVGRREGLLLQSHPDKAAQWPRGEHGYATYAHRKLWRH